MWWDPEGREGQPNLVFVGLEHLLGWWLCKLKERGETSPLPCLNRICLSFVLGTLVPMC